MASLPAMVENPRKNVALFFNSLAGKSKREGFRLGGGRCYDRLS
jgi:hypothetical protein